MVNLWSVPFLLPIKRFYILNATQCISNFIKMIESGKMVKPQLIISPKPGSRPWGNCPDSNRKVISILPAPHIRQCDFIWAYFHSRNEWLFILRWAGWLVVFKERLKLLSGYRPQNQVSKKRLWCAAAVENDFFWRLSVSLQGDVQFDPLNKGNIYLPFVRSTYNRSGY